MKTILSKMNGGAKSPPRVGLSEIFWSCIGGFLGVGAVAFINYSILGGTDMVMIIGSFGASAVLIYGAIKSPLAQPRNLIGGHLLSAIIGVAAYQLLQGHIPLSAAVAVAMAIGVMELTKTLHPPGGATALIAVIGSPNIHALGYLYVVIPVGLGAVIMLAIALIVNNIPRHRKYPEFWY
ncbi:MAG: HPP family protein [Chloroflexi bacterium]|nr:HPP family protein [Chloroflexota bacterium]